MSLFLLLYFPRFIPNLRLSLLLSSFYLSISLSSTFIFVSPFSSSFFSLPSPLHLSTSFPPSNIVSTEFNATSTALCSIFSPSLLYSVLPLISSGPYIPILLYVSPTSIPTFVLSFFSSPLSAFPSFLSFPAFCCLPSIILSSLALCFHSLH